MKYVKTIRIIFDSVDDTFARKTDEEISKHLSIEILKLAATIKGFRVVEKLQQIEDKKPPRHVHTKNEGEKNV